jgi:hypothetical protein
MTTIDLDKYVDTVKKKLQVISSRRAEKIERSIYVDDMSLAIRVIDSLHDQIHVLELKNERTD